MQCYLVICGEKKKRYYPDITHVYLDSILKSRDITLTTKVCLVNVIVFPLVMYGRESWTLKKAECRRIDAFELIVYIVSYCNRFIILSHNYYVKGKHIKKKKSKTNSQRIDAFVVLEKTLESPLVCKEMQPVHPKGDQSWVLIGGTDVEAEIPILWPPDVKS